MRTEGQFRGSSWNVQLKSAVPIKLFWKISFSVLLMQFSLCKVQGFYWSILLKTELQLVLFSDNAYLSGTSISRNTFQGLLAISARLNMIQSSFLTFPLFFVPGLSFTWHFRMTGRLQRQEEANFDSFLSLPPAYLVNLHLPPKYYNSLQ